MSITKIDYITKVAVATSNTHIAQIANELHESNVGVDNAIEFLGYWDNLDVRSGHWSDDNNVFKYDSKSIYDPEATEFNVRNIADRYREFVEYILPDYLMQQRDDLQHKLDAIKKHTVEFTNGLITNNELIGYIQKITK